MHILEAYPYLIASNFPFLENFISLSLYFITEYVASSLPTETLLWHTIIMYMLNITTSSEL